MRRWRRRKKPRPQAFPRTRRGRLSRAALGPREGRAGRRSPCRQPLEDGPWPPPGRPGHWAPIVPVRVPRLRGSTARGAALRCRTRIKAYDPNDLTPFRRLFDLALHGRPFRGVAQIRLFQNRYMQKDIWGPVRGDDEAVTLFGIEPLHLPVDRGTAGGSGILRGH